MYSLTRLIPVRNLLLQQLPTLLMAGVIAELFYKFHSFTLECAAFLATWYLIDLLPEVLCKWGVEAMDAIPNIEFPSKEKQAKTWGMRSTEIGGRLKSTQLRESAHGHHH